MKRVTYVALIVYYIVVPDVSWAGFDEGLAAYNNGNYAIALKEWRPLAEQGNAGAQNNLGWMYANGYGAGKNNTEAVKWFTKAAEQGNVSSQHWLGFRYSETVVGKKNGEAAKWYAKAAEQFEINADQGDASAIPDRASTANQKKAAKTSKAVRTPKAGHIFRDCPSCPEMVVVPSGSFDMGSPDSEDGRGDDESPVHRVNVATFALGKTEITRNQFAAFVKKTKYSAGEKCWTLEGGKFEERSGNWEKPGYPQDDQHPVACINWNDAKAYAEWMSRKTGKKYRLPTEAEWEYAARGNTSTALYWGGNPAEACGYTNAADKTAQAQIPGATSWSAYKCMDGFAYTAPVGSFKANAFGLKDMLGNVWEWTEDSYHDSYKGAPTDGSAWQGDGAKRVLRGGSWNNGSRNTRAAVRDSNKPALRFSIFGFRLARMFP